MSKKCYPSSRTITFNPFKGFNDKSFIIFPKWYSCGKFFKDFIEMRLRNEENGTVEFWVVENYLELFIHIFFGMLKTI
jgi:hypothetical protein